MYVTYIIYCTYVLLLQLYDVIHGPLQNVQPLFRSKSAKISQTRRMEGERAIDLKKFDRALLLLTQSVMQAPYTGNIIFNFSFITSD